MHVSPLQDPKANSQEAPAGQSIYIPEEMAAPSTYARVPDRFVPIPQHIRSFLDTTHEPTASGFVPSRRPDASDDINMADNYYYKIRRLSPVRHPATNRVLSAYNGVELKPNSTFSAHQFDEYIFHAVRKSRLFMFRVEKQAALTGHRHPRGLESTRCRFAKCPINGTIRPGQIRVCVSEFLDPRNEVLDPYHNAAYVHLYCLENFCNLPSLLAETHVAFLPAGQLAKESHFPPALNAPEREACLQWAHQARQHWASFKRAYPLPEARPSNVPTNTPLSPSLGDILPSGSAEGAQTEFYTNGAGGPGQGAEYSTEQINSLLAEYFADNFADFLGFTSEDFPWNELEQAPQPEQDNQTVDAVKFSVVTECWSKPRRSSAPPVLSVQNARTWKGCTKEGKGERRESFAAAETARVV
ncbi:hypothetical protein LA080_011114 [Diaporthe eres]|nr:hypothetical protein LA080_011114 [Diaporthe eres]